jgi:hypothetical protein
VAALKRGLESQQNVFRKQSNDKSYSVTHLLAKERKPFFDGKFVRKFWQHTVQEICPEK